MIDLNKKYEQNSINIGEKLLHAPIKIVDTYYHTDFFLGGTLCACYTTTKVSMITSCLFRGWISWGIPNGTLFLCWSLSLWSVWASQFVTWASNLNSKISERLIEWQYCLKIFYLSLIIITFDLIRIDIDLDLSIWVSFLSHCCKL